MTTAADYAAEIHAHETQAEYCERLIERMGTIQDLEHDLGFSAWLDDQADEYNDKAKDHRYGIDVVWQAVAADAAVAEDEVRHALKKVAR
jgi:hypothetical protein